MSSKIIQDRSWEWLQCSAAALCPSSLFHELNKNAALSNIILIMSRARPSWGKWCLSFSEVKVHFVACVKYEPTERREVVGLCRSEVRLRLQLHLQSSVIHFRAFIGVGKTKKYWLEDYFQDLLLIIFLPRTFPLSCSRMAWHKGTWWPLFVKEWYAPRSSQHMFDPYSFCLVVLGLVFHLLWGTDDIDYWIYGFLAALLIELGLEVVGNSQFVLKRIRNNSGTSGEYTGNTHLVLSRSSWS